MSDKVKAMGFVVGVAPRPESVALPIELRAQAFVFS